MRSYRIWLVRIEASLAVLTGVLGVVTIFWRDWVEALTGWSPDHGSGSVEIGLIAVLFMTSVSCTVVARRTSHRLAAISS